MRTVIILVACHIRRRKSGSTTRHSMMRTHTSSFIVFRQDGTDNVSFQLTSLSIPISAQQMQPQGTGSTSTWFLPKQRSPSDLPPHKIIASMAVLLGRFSFYILSSNSSKGSPLLRFHYVQATQCKHKGHLKGCFLFI